MILKTISSNSDLSFELRPIEEWGYVIQKDALGNLEILHFSKKNVTKFIEMTKLVKTMNKLLEDLYEPQSEFQKMHSM